MYDREDIKKALETLRSGGIILYPTDTIWGLGCDATNEEAVSRIYDIKQRTDSKSMLILISRVNMLRSYIKEVPEVAWELIEAADKALTIIYPGVKNLSPNLIAEDGSIGIRLANDRFCEDLIDRFRKPIVSTSANISGKPSPRFFNEIDAEIKEAADHVVNYRQDDQQLRNASSIIKLSLSGVFEILR